ncbi:hypothetical protein ACWD3J_14170 [Streptomyces sp. NPDC002755]
MTTTDHATDERELRSQAIALLLGAAETSGEINTLTRVGRRAGFLWTCPSCRTDNYANRETCCDKPRPATA